MPDLLSASSQSLLAGLLGNYSLDCRVRSLASLGALQSPALRPGLCPGSLGALPGLCRALPGSRGSGSPASPLQHFGSALGSCLHQSCSFCAGCFPGSVSSRDAGMDSGPFTPAVPRSLFPGDPGGFLKVQSGWERL